LSFETAFENVTPSGIGCTRQYVLAGLKKIKDTERSEHTAICPVVPLPVSTPPHLLPNFETIRVLKISVPQKRPIFVLPKLRFDFFLDFGPISSLERDIRKKKYFPGHIDGLVQLLCGIGNELFIKWCLEIINSKLNAVRA